MMRQPHKRSIRGAAAWLLLACGLPIAAQDLPPEMASKSESGRGPRALQVALERAWSPSDQTLRLSVADTPTSKILTAPRPKAGPDELIVLRFQVRLATPSFAGWNNFLQMHVGEKRLGSVDGEGRPRILNRTSGAMRTSAAKWPSEAYFKNFVGHLDCLLTAFGPTWDAIEPRFITDRDELYWYLLDITDLCRGDNIEITFTNQALAKMFSKTVEHMKDQPLLIDGVEIGVVDRAVRDRLIEDFSKTLTGYKSHAQASHGDIKLSASIGGALRIEHQGNAWFCRSSFSEPGDRIHYNRLQIARGDWVQKVVARDNAITITADAGPYTVERVATIEPPFIRVADTITNTGDDVGIALQHDLIADKPGQRWRLCGMTNATTYSECAANPSAHLAGTDAGIGAAIIDTAMRAQLIINGGRQKLSFVNEHFGLAQGESHTINWQIYVGGPDYWDFVNAVRRDWGSNATIPGMFSFWRPHVEPYKSLMDNPDALRAYLKRKRIDVFSVTPWFEYYYKPKYWKPRSVYKQTVQETMRKVKAAHPDAKVIACLESFLYWQPESFFAGTLPKFWTDTKGKPPGPRPTHTLSLGDAGTKLIDATPWRDSVFRNAAGHVEIDLYYSTRYEDGSANLKVFPTLDNYWHKRFLDILDFCIDDCGLDGVYIDSFNYYVNRTHDRWDGRSVDINPATGEIARKYSALGILTAPARRAWVKRVTDKGKIVYVNGKRLTQELQDTQQIGFMEAEWTFDPSATPLNAPRAAKAQLSAPLALGVRAHRYKPQVQTQYAQIIHKAVIAYLRHGALYCHYETNIPAPGKPGGGEYGILNHLFPFTPIELHEGYVIGKERIVTCVSGTFDWPHREKPTCLRFDLRGLPVDGGVTMMRTQTGWRVKLKLNDWKETAVIMAAKEAL